MPTRTIKLKLPYARLEAIEGSGSDLTFKVRGHRETKAGTTEFYEMELRVCRSGVRQILEQLKAMHVRDRERINRELARIQNEVNALKVDP